MEAIKICLSLLLLALCSMPSSAEDPCAKPDPTKPIYPHPNECQLFIECSNGGSIIKKCGEGLYYDPSVSSCRNWSEMPPERQEKCTEKEDPGAKPDPTKPIYPHPNNCKWFIEYSNGGMTVRGCGEGLYFDPSISSCRNWSDMPRDRQEKCADKGT